MREAMTRGLGDTIAMESCRQSLPDGTGPAPDARAGRVRCVGWLSPSGDGWRDWSPLLSSVPTVSMAGRHWTPVVPAATVAAADRIIRPTVGCGRAAARP